MTSSSTIFELPLNVPKPIAPLVQTLKLYNESDHENHGVFEKKQLGMTNMDLKSQNGSETDACRTDG